MNFINQEVNEDGTLKHIINHYNICHVLYYSDLGVHCSEPNCEINKGVK